MGRACLFHGPGQPLEHVWAPDPRLREGEILVSVLACTLCRSDLHSHAGRRHVSTPTVLGHEVVGRIDAFGPRARRIDLNGNEAAVGDRITWSITVGCGECLYCQRDLPQKCERLFKYGHEVVTAEDFWSGGLADRIVLRRGAAWLKVPGEISDNVAALMNCAAATAAAALRSAGEAAGRNVVVVGAGALGAFACAMAAAAGARQILAVDVQPQSRERAQLFGATLAIDPNDAELHSTVAQATSGRGADIVVELAGQPSAVELALQLAGVGGTVVLAGSVAPGPSVNVDPATLVQRMITVRGIHNYHPRDLQTVAAFLADAGRAFPFDRLVAARVTLDCVDEAFRRAHAAPGVRIAVVPSAR